MRYAQRFLLIVLLGCGGAGETASAEKEIGISDLYGVWEATNDERVMVFSSDGHVWRFSDGMDSLRAGKHGEYGFKDGLLGLTFRNRYRERKTHGFLVESRNGGLAVQGLTQAGVPEGKEILYKRSILQPTDFQGRCWRDSKDQATQIQFGADKYTLIMEGESREFAYSLRHDGRILVEAGDNDTLNLIHLKSDQTGKATLRTTLLSKTLGTRSDTWIPCSANEDT